MVLAVGDFVTLKRECQENDQQSLCNVPVGQISHILPDGRVMVGVIGIEDHEMFQAYRSDEVTADFFLDVRMGDPPYTGYIVEQHDHLDEIVIEDADTGDIHSYHVDWIDGINIRIVKNTEAYLEHMRRVERHRESLPNLVAMSLASKKGTLEHLPLNPNVQGKVLSFLSGYNIGQSSENTHKKVIGEYLSRGEEAAGAGANQRYGRELPLRERDPFNVALYNAPLPHGPTEENFMGGKRSGAKRKSSSRIGNKMARRGTRRSAGIFSRLYSPVGHLLSAGKESVGAVTNTAKGVVGEGVSGLNKIGRSVTKHANMAVKDVFSRKRKGGKRRGTRKSRKSRRNTRRRR